MPEKMMKCPKGFNKVPGMPWTGVHPCSGCQSTYLDQQNKLTCPACVSVSPDWEKLVEELANVKFHWLGRYEAEKILEFLSEKGVLKIQKPEGK